VKEGQAGSWLAVSTHVAEIHSRVMLPKFSDFSSGTLQPQLIWSNDGKRISIVAESPRDITISQPTLKDHPRMAVV
jgi:hypothetical protein